MKNLKIKRLSKNAIIPTRATSGSAGYDLYACIEEEVTVLPGEHVLIPTGIAIQLPDSGYAAMVYARSGLAIKHGLGLLNGVGVIDSDYTGEIKVGLINQGHEPYTISQNERIAQLIIHNVVCPELCEVESLGETERGEGGFGSTGRK